MERVGGAANRVRGETDSQVVAGRVAHAGPTGGDMPGWLSCLMGRRRRISGVDSVGGEEATHTGHSAATRSEWCLD